MHCSCPINSRNSMYGLSGCLGDLGQFLLLLFPSKSWFFSSVTYNWSGKRGWLVDWFLKLSFCYEVVFLPSNKISCGNPMRTTVRVSGSKRNNILQHPFLATLFLVHLTGAGVLWTVGKPVHHTSDPQSSFVRVTASPHLPRLCTTWIIYLPNMFLNSDTCYWLKF